MVNISSVQAHHAQPSHTGWTYQASKAAVTTMSKCIALDLSAHGIRVNSICPGYIWTEHVMLQMLLVVLLNCKQGLSSSHLFLCFFVSWLVGWFIHSLCPHLFLADSLLFVREGYVFFKISYQNKLFMLNPHPQGLLHFFDSGLLIWSLNLLQWFAKFLCFLDFGTFRISVLAFIICLTLHFSWTWLPFQK